MDKNGIGSSGIQAQIGARAMQKQYFKISAKLICAFGGMLGSAILGFLVMNMPQDAVAQMPGGPQGPMPVVVESVKREPLVVWTEFSGRLVPVDYAVIRPQVSGVITEVRFEDGQAVQKDDVLFVIDPRPFEAALKEAKAGVAIAENAYVLAQNEFTRAQGLIATNAISKREFEARERDFKTTKASLEAAKAQLQNANINIDYAYVKAPISGRVGRAELTVGNVAQAAGLAAPMLTSVVSSEAIYADFEVDEQTYLKSVRAQASDKSAEQEIPVQIIVGEQSSQPIEGKIHTFDNRIDPQSGTIRARALFDNAQGVLLPGMFAKVRLGSASSEERIMVSEKAIGTDQNRKFVYVVDEKNIVQYRPVQLGMSSEGRREVIGGLEAGEKIITEGIMRIQPQMPVQPMSAQEMQEMQKQQQPPAALLPQENQPSQEVGDQEAGQE